MMNNEQRIKELEAEKVARIFWLTPFKSVINDLNGNLLFTGVDYDECYQWCIDHDYDIMQYELTRINPKSELLNKEQEDKRSVATEAPSTTEADKITNNPLLGERVIYVPDWNGNGQYTGIPMRQTTISSYIKELNRVG